MYIQYCSVNAFFTIFFINIVIKKNLYNINLFFILFIFSLMYFEKKKYLFICLYFITTTNTLYLVY